MANTFGQECSISALSDIETSVRGSNLTVGERCMIDAFVKIKFAGGTGHVQIGNRCYINSGTVLYSGNGITIGNQVLIAANCTLAPVNHAIKRNIAIQDQGFMPSRGGIVIEDDVWIGANTVVLDGTIIRQGCVVAAGSVVRGELKAYGVYAGNPASFVKERPAQC